MFNTEYWLQEWTMTALMDCDSMAWLIVSLWEAKIIMIYYTFITIYFACISIEYTIYYKFKTCFNIYLILYY